MSDAEQVQQALAELWDIVKCRCNEAYTGRGLHDPDCECDSEGALQIVADRIEALTEQLTAAQHDAKEAEAYAEEVEAKLAKAVAALRNCPPTSNPTISAQEHLDRINAWWRLEARATLAEIKGESHE